MKNVNDEHRYDDMLFMPHHRSKTRPQMSLHDRAAQFSPFAALSGLSAALAEQERITTEKKELSEEEGQRLSEQLRRLERGMRVRAVYYLRDGYVTASGRVTRIDPVFRTLCVGQTQIAFEELLDIQIDDGSGE